MENKAEKETHAPLGETMEEIVERRISRRSILKGVLAGLPLLLLGPSLPGSWALAGNRGKLDFDPIDLTTENGVVVSEGYASDVLLRWGDPLFPGAPVFNPFGQTAWGQSLQFGYNCDFVGFFPLPYRSQNPNRGLLTVNHEYTNPELMFPGYVSGNPTREQIDIEIAAHGLTVVEIARQRGRKREWDHRIGSRFNRRITGETEIEITGPAAGSPLMQVSYDPTGRRVRGMFNNCGGGKTPWGTLLTCEENFNQYFANLNLIDASDPRRAIHRRYGLPSGASERRWENFHDRFDLSKEPNEPFRFGWVVEIDPYNPDFVPKKRTALGRLKHEAATVVIAPNRHAVVYTGDDERFDYMYKFVSRDPIRTRREDNFDLLDEGVLHVARFHDDGTGVWIPLVGGEGPLAAWSQAEVLVNTRGAADLVGATRMDRPEDIETNPVNGRVYCVMTNNTQRGTTGNPGTDAANPRTVNRYGHILELTEDGEDPSGRTFTWEIFILCGDPNNPAHGAYFAGFDEPEKVSPISSPDNILFDKKGNLWIATDGRPGTLGGHDGIFAVPTDGEDRGFVRQLLSGPIGCELASLEFTPDNHTLFCSIQHPAEGSRFESPSTLWPDNATPPRPSVIAVTKSEGSKVIGT